MRLIDAWRDVRTISRLLGRAEAEARRGGEDQPGPEHLVLAAAGLPDATAADALARVGADAERLRGAIERVHEAGLAAAGVAGDHGTVALRAQPRGILRATPPAQQVFRDAVALSKRTKPSRLRGAHVVAAACELEHGTFVRALAALDVDRATLAAAARATTAAR